MPSGAMARTSLQLSGSGRSSQTRPTFSSPDPRVTFPINLRGIENLKKRSMRVVLASPSTCIPTAVCSSSDVEIRLSIPSDSVAIQVPNIYHRVACVIKRILSTPTTSTFSLPKINLSDSFFTTGFQVGATDNFSFSGLGGACPYYPGQEGGQSNYGGDDGDQDDADDGEEGGEGLGDSSQPGPTERTRLFACPYYGYDPIRHWRCYKKYDLKRLADVKYHIERVHLMKDLYCPICWKDFKTTREWVHHCRISPPICPRARGPEKLFREDFAEMGEILNTNRRLSEERRWYMMFDHIFPEGQHRRPAAPYIFSSFDEAIEVMRQHFERVYQQGVLQGGLINMVLPASAQEMTTTRPYERRVPPSLAPPPAPEDL